jgi:glucokinase
MSDASGSSTNVFALRPHELRQVGGGVALVDAPALVIALSGTFRATLWLPACGRDGRAPIAGDLGRIALHAHEPDESAVLDVLRRRHGQLATAQVLCADGLVELHRATCLLRGAAAPRLGAREIAAEAALAASPECARAMSLFCGLLGDAAGRAALTVGAAGGVFIAGDLVTTLGDWFARSPFRRRFEACGGDAQALRATPTCVVIGEGDRADAIRAASDRGRAKVH